MRELDVLLLGWLERHYADTGAARKAAFQSLLSLPDAELTGYLLGGELPADPTAADVVKEIRNTART